MVNFRRMAIAMACAGAIATTAVPVRASATTANPPNTLPACQYLASPTTTVSTQVLLSSDNQGDTYDIAIGDGAVYLHQFATFAKPTGPGVAYGTNWTLDEVAHGTGLTRLALFCNGNLALLAPNNAVLWQSQTANRGGKILVLTSGGALEILNTSDKAIWTSGSGRDVIGSGDSLEPGQVLIGARQPNYPNHTLEMQTDGNLVYRDNGVIGWQTGTDIPGSHAVLTVNDQLQVVSPTGEILWSTSPRGDGGFLSMYSGTIYDGVSDRAIWTIPNFWPSENSMRQHITSDRLMVSHGRS